jgi:hypothetical protein
MVCSLVLLFGLQDTFLLGSIVAFRMTKWFIACSVDSSLHLTGKIRYELQPSFLTLPGRTRRGSDSENDDPPPGDPRRHLIGHLLLIGDLLRARDRNGARIVSFA